MKINLTDQELNDWLAVNVMGWVMTKLYPKEDRIWHDFSESPFRQFTCWNPSNNLHHTHLMEDKIREMGRDKAYAISLFDLLLGNNRPFDLIHASSRQRVEAAYLTFNENKT